MVHFKDFEDTVLRSDETQKNEYVKNKKKLRRIKTARIVLCAVAVATLLVSGTFLAKRGIEKYLVIKQEEDKKYTLSNDVIKELENIDKICNS